MLLVNLTWAILVLVGCTPAWLWGGRDGKWLCIMLGSAAVLSPVFVEMLWDIVPLPISTFAFDALLATGLLYIAVRTDRYWPIWIIAFHLLSLLAFFAWLLVPGVTWKIYKAVAAFWSIPIFIILCVGPLLDRLYMRRVENSRVGIGSNPN